MLLLVPPPPAMPTAGIAANVAEVAHASAAQCNGETITRIDVYRYAPSRRTARTRAADAADSTVTQRGQRLDSDTDVVRAYLRLREGQPCLEQERADSERMLRVQRFVASAAVTPVPDGPGRVRIRVDVVNEFELVLGGGLNGLRLNSVRLGSLDWRGHGTAVIGTLEQGEAYRDGVGLSIAQPGFLGRPATLSVAAAQRPLGGGASLSLIQPFLADGQRFGFVFNVDGDVEYLRLLRGPQTTVRTRTEHSTYQAAILRRIGQARQGRPIGLAGVLVGGTLANTDEGLMEVSDTGLVSVSDSTLRGRYPTYRTNHIAAIGAIRALRFRTVARLDALRAEQDVATGVELTLVAGPSLVTSTLARDDFIGATLYLGRGGARSFTSIRARFDGRRGRALNAGEWLSSVTNVRGSWYRWPDERRTRQVTLSYAELQGNGLPFQLSMRDPEGGLIGYAGSTRPGGRRLTARLEDRRLMTSERFWADLAVGTFVDAGMLWRGDVPYGEDAPFLASAGISIMAAYPSGGKRLYRVEFGVPFVRGPGDGLWVIRVSASDRTQARTPEPRDVSRARLETGPASVLRW